MFPPLEQVALEREEILLELHEGRKAEEEAFKEQREMEDNIKRRLLLRWIELSTTKNTLIIEATTKLQDLVGIIPLPSFKNFVRIGTPDLIFWLMLGMRRSISFLRKFLFLVASF